MSLEIPPSDLLFLRKRIIVFPTEFRLFFSRRRYQYNVNLIFQSRTKSSILEKDCVSSADDWRTNCSEMRNFTLNTIWMQYRRDSRFIYSRDIFILASLRTTPLNLSSLTLIKRLCAGWYQFANNRHHDVPRTWQSAIRQRFVYWSPFVPRRRDTISRDNF